jgi:hypothetical protein
MKELQLFEINQSVSSRISPFFQEILKAFHENINSIYITGSAVTSDFNEKTSNINSTIILNELNFDFVEFLASLGKKFKGKKIAAPLVMTPEYIKRSCDVFPIEFFELRLIHKTVYGTDLLKDIQINKSDLRLQCEREVKTKLLGLWQGYISSRGEKDIMLNLLSKSITGSIALFRAIIFLLGKEPPVRKRDVIKTIEDITDIKKDVFEKMIMVKANLLKPSKEDLRIFFDQYYKNLEVIARLVDELQPSSN